jgi:hypothetical protein
MFADLAAVCLWLVQNHNIARPQDAPDLPEIMAEKGIESFSPPLLPGEDPAEIEKQRVAQLWQGAHNYEYAEISGSAVGMLAMGVMLGKPKCVAVQNWIKSIWTQYYIRKAGTSTDYNYDFAGPCPFSCPELMEELGL